MRDRLGLGPLLGRRRWWLAGGVLLIFLSLAAGVMLLSLSGWFITASALAGLGLIAALDVFTPGAGIRLAAITRTVSRYLERLVTHEATFRLLADLRLRLFDHLLTLDEGQLRGLQRGDTLNRLTADVDTLDHLFLGVIGPGVSAFVLTLLAGALTGWLVDPWLAAATLGLVLAVNPLVAELTRRRGHDASRALVTAMPGLRRHASDNLEALQDVVAFDLGERERGELEQRSARVIGLQERLQKLDAIAQALVTLTGLVGVWLALVLGIGLLRAGLITGPVLGLLALGVLALGEAWQGLPAAWRRLEQCRGAAQRLGETMEREPLLPAADPGLPPAGQRLELRQVSFRYREDLPPVLQDFDLEIAPGERVALVGPSGAGKSTLAMLMMRQLDPDAGTVCLEGVDLRRLDQDLLRRHIGLLAQRPVLFRDTLAANLRLAAPAASDAMLFQALETAGLADFAAGLEHGPETWIDEAASNISGGEARRIALARLVLTDCPIVILDEPTTGLDAATAGGISATLDTWLQGRTAIMITHDPALLPPHDRIVRVG
ncbi:MAG TPA: thiol reductant ABC exporter subunit CydC [Gammaproteobacteria bacterium]|nr:thiol reductant ABC exporter subunit CydC [Gammaproteobacteria bacterium]